MTVAGAAAIAMEDLAIESVSEWAGSSRQFGEGVFNELFDENHRIKDLYLCAAAELYVSSLIRNDPTGMMITLCRMAANQWFLRQAVKRFGAPSSG